MEERIITTTEEAVEEIIRTDARKTCGKGGLIAFGAAALVGGIVAGYKFYQNHKAKKAQLEVVDEADDEFVDEEIDSEE